MKSSRSKATPPGSSRSFECTEGLTITSWRPTTTSEENSTRHDHCWSCDDGHCRSWLFRVSMTGKILSARGQPKTDAQTGTCLLSVHTPLPVMTGVAWSYHDLPWMNTTSHFHHRTYNMRIVYSVKNTDLLVWKAQPQNGSDYSWHMIFRQIELHMECIFGIVLLSVHFIPKRKIQNGTPKVIWINFNFTGIYCVYLIDICYVFMSAFLTLFLSILFTSVRFCVFPLYLKCQLNNGYNLGSNIITIQHFKRASIKYKAKVHINTEHKT